MAGSALIRFSYAAGWPAEMKAPKKRETARTLLVPSIGDILGLYYGDNGKENGNSCHYLPCTQEMGILGP